MHIFFFRINAISITLDRYIPCVPYTVEYINRLKYPNYEIKNRKNEIKYRFSNADCRLLPQLSMQSCHSFLKSCLQNVGPDARHLWPLSKERSLSCPLCWDRLGGLVIAVLWIAPFSRVICKSNQMKQIAS